jgi:hypothetical protein
MHSCAICRCWSLDFLVNTTLHVGACSRETWKATLPAMRGAWTIFRDDSSAHCRKRKRHRITEHRETDRFPWSATFGNLHSRSLCIASRWRGICRTYL